MLRLARLLKILMEVMLQIAGPGPTAKKQYE